MKYFTSAIVVLALLGANMETTSAIKIQQKFTDDLVKSLAEEMNQDAEKAAVEPTPTEQTETSKEPKKVETKNDKKEAKPVDKKAAAKKDDKKPAAKADSKSEAAPKAKAGKKEEDEIPMDNAAIKAYSSVIADAAEDSEP